MTNSGITLVTGASGFVGACLTRRLVAMNNEVHIITRKESNKWRIQDILGRIIEHNVDLTDRDGVERLISNVRPNIVYHFAAYGGHPFQTDTYEIMQTNIMGTINLVKACSKIEYDCLVNIGSSSEYGLKHCLMKETDVLEPRSDYAVSKASATLYCLSVSQREQRPIVTLRLFSPYGNFDAPTRLIPYVILSCLQGRNPRLSSRESVRDYIFIEDVLDVCVDIVRSHNVLGQILNVGSGEQHSVEEVAQKVIELTRSNVSPLWDETRDRHDEPKVWAADISRVKSVLNWEPKYDLQRGLRKTIEWFLENLQFYK